MRVRRPPQLYLVQVHSTYTLLNVAVEAAVLCCAGKRERGQVSSQDRGQIWMNYVSYRTYRVNSIWSHWLLQNPVAIEFQREFTCEFIDFIIWTCAIRHAFPMSRLIALNIIVEWNEILFRRFHLLNLKSQHRYAEWKMRAPVCVCANMQMRVFAMRCTREPENSFLLIVFRYYLIFSALFCFSFPILSASDYIYLTFPVYTYLPIMRYVDSD